MTVLHDLGLRLAVADLNPMERSSDLVEFLHNVGLLCGEELGDVVLSWRPFGKTFGRAIAVPSPGGRRQSSSSSSEESSVSAVGLGGVARWRLSVSVNAQPRADMNVCVMETFHSCSRMKSSKRHFPMAVAN